MGGNRHVGGNLAGAAGGRRALTCLPTNWRIAVAGRMPHHNGWRGANDLFLIRPTYRQLRPFAFAFIAESPPIRR
jgi:hypothetical protein